jgi:transcriptional regulator with XRE-family HTH domain
MTSQIRTPDMNVNRSRAAHDPRSNRNASINDAIVKRAFAEVLRELRSEIFQLEQTRLAAQCQINRSHYCSLEQGRWLPTVQMLWRVSRGFPLTPSVFVGLVEKRIQALVKCRPYGPIDPRRVSRIVSAAANLTLSHQTNDSVNVALGMAVRHLRGIVGISQETLARKAGVCRASTSAMECGKKSVTLVTLLQMAQPLRATARRIFETMEGEMSRNPTVK